MSDKAAQALIAADLLTGKLRQRGPRLYERWVGDGWVPLEYWGMVHEYRARAKRMRRGRRKRA